MNILDFTDLHANLEKQYYALGQELFTEDPEG